MKLLRPSARFVSLLAAGTIFLAGCGGSQRGGQPTGASAVSAAPPPAATAPQRSDAPPASDTGGFDGQLAFEHVAKLVSFGPHPPASEGIRRAQEYIHAQLQSFGCAAEDQEFHAQTPLGTIAMKNIAAKIPGKSQDILVLATHYDSKLMDNFVGADDGGSSTAVMLELARRLCERQNALTIWIVFFDGEEAFREWSETDGVYGSREMAARLAISGEIKRIKAFLLADLVGGQNPRFKRESNSTRWLTALVWSTAARLGYQNIFLQEESAVEDDHLPFLHRGVAAADIIDLEQPMARGYWHTPKDTLDKVSGRSLAIVGHVILESIPEIEKRFTK